MRKTGMTVTQDWSSHSGSRWEPISLPAPPVTPYATVGFGSAAAPGLDAVPRRRRRGPVVALLVTLLSLGTATAGVAYARTPDSPAVPTSQTNGGPAPAGEQDPAGRHRGDHSFADRGTPDRQSGPGASS